MLSVVLSVPPSTDRAAGSPDPHVRRTLVEELGERARLAVDLELGNHQRQGWLIGHVDLERQRAEAVGAGDQRLEGRRRTSALPAAGSCRPSPRRRSGGRSPRRRAAPARHRGEPVAAASTSGVSGPVISASNSSATLAASVSSIHLRLGELGPHVLRQSRRRAVLVGAGQVRSTTVRETVSPTSIVSAVRVPPGGSLAAVIDTLAGRAARSDPTSARPLSGTSPASALDLGR